MSQALLDAATHLLGDAITKSFSYRGDETVVVQATRIAEVMQKLRNDDSTKLDFLVDLTAVDRLGLVRTDDEPRFEVVYHLRSMTNGHRLRVKAPVAEPEDGSSPTLDSVVALWAGADWYEREVWDMYGIKFRGHPDLRRILMYEEFIGHPLRKDYPKEKRQPLIRRAMFDMNE
jgi:NADH-quinone oxidoreductase subunit C